MKLRLALSAIVLSLTPAFASAMCSGMSYETTASSCMAGQVWDNDTASCVDPVTS
ncbi:MAG: hypothetical protein IKG52_05450 [Rhodobacteraceae bacterium]|nr:hypothetical protein [Paracoccaceae bacterium]